MKNETKILLNRTDGLDVAVDKIIHAPTFVVVLVVPKESVLINSMSNFNALKRESDTAGKALMIESTDERAHEFAERANIIAQNPPRISERPAMDIVRRVSKIAPKIKASLMSESRVKNEEESEHKERSRNADVLAKKAPTFFKPILQSARVDLVEADTTEKPKEKKSRKRVIFVFLVAGALFATILWYAVVMLPMAIITLFVKHETVESEDVVTMGKDYKEVSTIKGLLYVPAELLSEKGNFVMSFPASGTESVETNAVGKLTVYNAYSAASQALVKGTRFESPDGKIFRLNKAVTIPAAKLVKGKLTPSTIEVSVTADKSGADYNIQPATRWTIPGFKGKPQFTGFYADSVDAMTGGATGLRPKLSDADRMNAESEVSEALRASLGMRILVVVDKFKTFASSTDFSITKKEELVDKNDEGKFGMYMEGEMKQLMFDENVLRDAFIAKARTNNTATDKVDMVRVEYGEPKFDFNNGTITVNVKSFITFSPNINIDEVKNNILGNTKSSAEMTILGLPKLESASVAFWPFWVNSVPTSCSRVEIIIK